MAKSFVNYSFYTVSVAYDQIFVMVPILSKFILTIFCFETYECAQAEKNSTKRAILTKHRNTFQFNLFY